MVNADEVRDEVLRLRVTRDLLLRIFSILAPAPNRGKRNEPSFVVHTAETLANVKGMTARDLQRCTTDNFFRLFSRAERHKSP